MLLRIAGTGRPEQRSRRENRVPRGRSRGWVYVRFPRNGSPVLLLDDRADCGVCGVRVRARGAARDFYPKEQDLHERGIRLPGPVTVVFKSGKARAPLSCSTAAKQFRWWPAGRICFGNTSSRRGTSATESKITVDCDLCTCDWVGQQPRIPRPGAPTAVIKIFSASLTHYKQSTYIAVASRSHSSL